MASNFAGLGEPVGREAAEQDDEHESDRTGHDGHGEVLQVPLRTSRPSIPFSRRRTSTSPSTVCTMLEIEVTTAMPTPIHSAGSADARERAGDEHGGLNALHERCAHVVQRVEHPLHDEQRAVDDEAGQERQDDVAHGLHVGEVGFEDPGEG